MAPSINTAVLIALLLVTHLTVPAHAEKDIGDCIKSCMVKTTACMLGCIPKGDKAQKCIMRCGDKSMRCATKCISF